MKIEGVFYVNKKPEKFKKQLEEKGIVLSENEIREICEKYGGRVVYFPKKRATRIRNLKILMEFLDETADEIAEKYNLSRWRIYKIVKNLRNNIKKEDILYLIGAGYPLRKIAEAYHISIETLEEILTQKK